MMDQALSNQRHERFAQALSQGMTVDDAYAEAGYSANSGTASRLYANVNIRGRVMELQTKAADAHEVTRERLIGMCIDVFESAGEAGNAHSAQIAAIREIGILTGLRVEKHVPEVRGRELTKEQCDAAVAAALRADD